MKDALGTSEAVISNGLKEIFPQHNGVWTQNYMVYQGSTRDGDTSIWGLNFIWLSFWEDDNPLGLKS